MLCMKKFCLIVNVLFLLISCGEHREARSVMNEAESLMMTVPDSSLALLNGINEEALYTKGSRASYILLRTMAKDKCYMDVAQDTVIQESYNWYQRHGSRRERMLATYYQGVVREQAGDNIEAVLAFREAEPLAESLEDYRQLSLIEQHLCEIYSCGYDYVMALEFAQKSLMAAENANDSIMVAYCKYDVAFQLISEWRYGEAEVVLNNLLERSSLPPTLYSEILSLKARTQIYKKPYDYKLARELYDRKKEIKDVPYTASEYGTMAFLEEVEGKHAQADDYLFEESCLLSNAIDSLGFFNDSYNVFERRKDWEKASLSLAKRADIQDRIVKKLLAQSTTHALECFYKDRLKWEQLRTRNRHWIVGIIGVFLLAIIILLIWLLHKKDQKLLEDMACFQEFGNELSRLKDNDVLTYQVIERLISDKVQSLQSLSESYFAWDDDAIKRKEKREGKMMKDDVIHAFRNQLSELRKNQSFIQALEDMLDMTEHGIMKKARSLLDTENELDFIILTLLFSGFSIKSISYLLRMSEASLRMRKTRYKHRFEKFQEPERGLLLRKLT